MLACWMSFSSAQPGQWCEDRGGVGGGDNAACSCLLLWQHCGTECVCGNSSTQEHQDLSSTAAGGCSVGEGWEWGCQVVKDCPDPLMFGENMSMSPAGLPGPGGLLLGSTCAVWGGPRETGEMPVSPHRYVRVMLGSRS